MDKKALIIEDDPQIADLIELHFRDLGIALHRATDGEVGLEMARAGSYGLLILDVMLPGRDGLDICKQLRSEQPHLPILMLTAKGEEIDKVVGLEMGADDYLSKPFGIRELIARVRALLRRTQPSGEGAGNGSGNGSGNGAERIRFPGLEIDSAKRRVAVRGETVDLTAKEYELLSLFAAHPGVPYNREQLLNLVWGYTFSGYEHTVNSHINRLRAKIEADPSSPRYILTVWGFGYRFAEAAELQAGELSA